MSTRWLTRMARPLWSHAKAYPFATNLSLISVPIGVIALVIGPDVSRAFTDVFGRPEPVYVWGVVLLVGGLNVAHGIIKNVPSRERGGLFVLAAAYGFYGVCVLVGLGVGGVVAGTIAVTLAVSALQRARVILTNARLVAEARQADG